MVSNWALGVRCSPEIQALEAEAWQSMLQSETLSWKTKTLCILGFSNRISVLTTQELCYSAWGHLEGCLIFLCALPFRPVLRMKQVMGKRSCTVRTVMTAWISPGSCPTVHRLHRLPFHLVCKASCSASRGLLITARVLQAVLTACKVTFSKMQAYASFTNKFFSALCLGYFIPSFWFSTLFKCR